MSIVLPTCRIDTGDLMRNRLPSGVDVTMSRIDPIERVVTVAHRAAYPGNLHCAA